MYRAASLLLLIVALSFTAISAQTSNSEKQPPAKAPGVEEIKKAIEELGSSRFVVRDRAKKLLQQAGSIAEPYLEEATKSSDPETANTAKNILEAYTWGLYPDTPKEIRDLVERYRVGTLDQRQFVLSKLVKMKPVPLATIRKLLAKEDDPDSREPMFANLYFQIQAALPELLNRRDYDTVESLFDVVLLGTPSLVASDYATFMHLRGKLEVTITRLESELKQKNNQAQQTAEVLVSLYRIKGDWAAARKAAAATKNDELVERVLWQASDWSALAAFPHKFESDRTDLRGNTVTNGVGMLAAYERLAGNTQAFNEKIEEIRKSVEDGMEVDSASLEKEVEALLLNGKADDTIKILSDRKKKMGLTFELLCTQMKHKEAFALVDEARTRDTDKSERQDIQLYRARMLSSLGEKGDARQLYQKLFDEEPAFRDNIRYAYFLIRSETRAQMRELAAEHAGEILDHMAKEGDFDRWSLLFRLMFGGDKTVARCWWNLFRQTKPDEKPAVAMKRVFDILAGKLDKKSFDDFVAKMEKAPANRPDGGGRRRLTGSTGRFANLDALAAAYRAIGDESNLEQSLQKAAEKGPTRARLLAYGDFLYEKKKYKEAASSFAKAAKAIDPLDDGDDDESIERKAFGPALPTYLQGRATTLAGDAAEGQRLTELASWLPLGDSEIRANLVDELSKRDWPEMARKEANMLLKTCWYDEHTGSALMYLARHAAKEKDFSKSVAYFEKSLVGYMRYMGTSFFEPAGYLVVPEAIQAFRIRGLFAAGKAEEGMKEAMNSLKRMPGNVELAIKLVPELEKLGKKEDADTIYRNVRDVLEKLLKDYPNSGYWRNSTAWVMVNCRRDLDAALKHATKAVELEPDNASYCDTLAEVYFRKGDREKALELMKKCVKLDSKKVYFKKQLVRFKDHPFISDTPDEEDGDD